METQIIPLKGGVSRMKRTISILASASLLASPFIGLFTLEEISFRNSYQHVAGNIYQRRNSSQLEYIHNKAIGIDFDADGVIDRQVPPFNPLLRAPRLLLNTNHPLWDKEMQLNYSIEYGQIQKR